MVLEGKEVRHITNKTIVHIITQGVSLNSAEYDTLARQLPLCLKTTFTSHRLFPISRRRLPKQSGHTDMNASCKPTNFPSYRRNCPRIPLTIPHPNCPATSPNHTSARSLRGFHVLVSFAGVTVHRVPKTASPHSSGRLPYSQQIF